MIIAYEGQEVFLSVSGVGLTNSTQVNDIPMHIVLILRLGYEKMQPNFEAAVRTPMKRASK